MHLKTLTKTIGIVLLTMLPDSGFAQDAIARQAPSDKRMRDINNVKLNNTFNNIDLENPAADIYTDWTDQIRKCGGSVPANYKVDLRGFCMPTDSRKITSNYGWRRRKRHEGIDVKVYIGDTIRAAFDGKVRIKAYNGGGYGYYIVLRHPNGLETLYGHLSKHLVVKDQVVRAGEPIGLGGNTGRSNGSHLHFETRILGQPINPALMFDFEHQDVTGNFYHVASGKTTRGEETAASRSIENMETGDATKDLATTGETDKANLANPATNEGESSSPQPVRTNVPKQSTKHSTSHYVKKGDTLSSIARKHGTTVDKLCRLNGIKPSTILQLGQKIKCS